MAKGKFAKKLLDMAKDARMRRARDMGFDTDRIFTHESPNSGKIKEIHEGGRFGGIFALEDSRAGYYENAQDFLIKGEPLGNSDIKGLIDDNYYLVSERAKDLFGYDADVDDILRQSATFEGLPSDLDADYYADLQRLRADIARMSGSSAVIQEDEFGETIQLLPGSGVRSVDATFDPAKKDSSNLLASAGAGIAASVAALQSNKAEANPQPQFVEYQFVEPKGKFAENLLSDYLGGSAFSGGAEIFNSSALINTGSMPQTIEAPVNEWALKAADWFDRYNKARKSRLHPVADMILPVGELPSDLFMKYGYGDDVTVGDRVSAVAGLL